MAYSENYRDNPLAAFPGAVADMSHATIVSRTSAASIGFGVPVSRASAAHTVQEVAAGATEVHGFTVRVQGTDANTENAYPAKSTVSVLRKGPIWVTVSEAVSSGDPVYVTIADATIVKTADGANTLEVSGASFETDAASGGVAKIHII